MVARLVTDVLRRRAGVCWLVFFLLTIWGLAEAVASRGPAAQRLGVLPGVEWTTLLLSLIAGQAVAFEALNRRVVQMLPVSRRDIWRARWILATLGAATLATAVRALTMVISRATAPAASDAFTQLVVTWSSTFILGGVLLALWLCVPRLLPVLPATGGFRSLLTPVVWFRFLRNELTACVWLLLAFSFIWGSIRLPWLLLPYVTMDWHDVSVSGSIATALALLVAIASYWHRPRVHTRAGRPPQAGTRWARTTLIPRGTLSAIRLLVFENVISACLSAAVILGLTTALMTVRQPFGEAVAGIASWFGHRLEFTTAGGVPPYVGSPLFFAILGGTWSSARTFNARHLRALPVSTLQLIGLLLLPAPLFWLAAITIVSGVHLAVIGMLPRIDASWLVLTMGLTALLQPVELEWRRSPLRASALIALISVAWGQMQRLPDVVAPLTHPITFGVLLAAIAFAWSYWLLTRSSTPFRADPLTAWTEP